MKDRTIFLKRATPADELFLLKVFSESRPDLQWICGEEQQKASLIRQQFLSEQQQLQLTYPRAEFNIVMLDAEPAGRLYLDYGQEVCRILAVGLLCQYRRMGIGSRIIANAMDKAAQMAIKVRLSVAWYNRPALDLYQRLGFVAVEDTGVCAEMEWLPR